MSWGLVAASVVSAGAAAYGANKQNKQAKSQYEAQLQAYYDSPDYRVGDYTSGLLMGIDDKEVFDNNKYIQANPDLEGVEKYRKDPQQHYIDHGKAEGRQAFYKPGRTGLLDMYYDAVINAKPPKLSGVSMASAATGTNYSEQLKRQLQQKGIF